MIKIKTFIYTDCSVPSASKIDEEINNFTKKHKVISVTPVTFVEGLSIPSTYTTVIMYTIVSEEAT